jgi:hypothetical protein
MDKNFWFGFITGVGSLSLIYFAIRAYETNRILTLGSEIIDSGFLNQSSPLSSGSVFFPQQSSCGCGQGGSL